MSFAESLEKNNPYPFGPYRSMVMLNPEEFDSIEGYVDGVSAYQKFTWDDKRGNFIKEGDIVGHAVSIHSDNLILSESDYSYIVVFRDPLVRYEYPKPEFILIKKCHLRYLIST